jgi:hypothetical protein
MSASIDHLAALKTPIERRFYPRIAPLTPETISLGPETPSSLLNLSENGFLLTTTGELDVNSVHRVSLDLNGIPKTITVYVRAVWTDGSQELAGIQFLDLSEDDRELLRRWSAMQTPQHENFPPSLLSEDREEFASAVAAQIATASAPSQRIFEEEAQTVTTVQSQPPARSSASSLYFWGAALAMMCLGAVWASTHDVLRDFRGGTPSAGSDHPSPSPEAQPTRPQSVANTANPEPKSTDLPGPASKSLGSDRIASTEASAKSKSPVAAANTQAVSPPETDSQDRSTFNRPVSSPADEPNQSAAVSKDLLAQPDSLPRSSPSETTSNSLPKPQDTAPQPAPANSRTEIATNAPPVSSAIVGSTHLPAPTSAANPASSASAAKLVSPSPPIRPADSSSAADSTAPSNARNSDRPTPHLNTSETGPSPFIVEFPFTRSETLVSLPGERVIDSPSVTMHVQRSVRVHAGLLRFWHRRKRVEVGQLSTRVDPQSPRSPRVGSITVQAMINEQGRITGIKPLYGSIELLPSVSRALNAWRYQPTYVDNKPVETVATIEVDFHSSPVASDRP